MAYRTEALIRRNIATTSTARLTAPLRLSLHEPNNSKEGERFEETTMKINEQLEQALQICLLWNFPKFSGTFSVRLRDGVQRVMVPGQNN